jgi:hypothetical protein
VGVGGGAVAVSECRFVWPYVRHPSALNSDIRVGLGVCIDYDQFQYDANFDGVPESPYPSCASLPPRSETTVRSYDDAADWGCAEYINTTGLVAPPFEVPHDEDGLLGPEDRVQID